MDKVVTCIEKSTYLCQHMYWTCKVLFCVKAGQSTGRNFSHRLLHNRTILLMPLQQIFSPLLHRIGLLSTGLTPAACFLIPIWLAYWINPLPSSVPALFSPSIPSLLQLSNKILLSFFHNLLWKLIKHSTQIISKWNTDSLFFHIVCRWLIFKAYWVRINTCFFPLKATNKRK